MCIVFGGLQQNWADASTGWGVGAKLPAHRRNSARKLQHAGICVCLAEPCPRPPLLLLQAPSYFSLHESALLLAVLLATVVPDYCELLGLTESVGHQEGLIKVGRAVLNAGDLRGCSSVMGLLAAMARCAVTNDSKLGLGFFRQRLTLSLVADLIKAAAARAEALVSGGSRVLWSALR